MNIYFFKLLNHQLDEKTSPFVPEKYHDIDMVHVLKIRNQFFNYRMYAFRQFSRRIFMSLKFKNNRDYHFC